MDNPTKLATRRRKTNKKPKQSMCEQVMSPSKTAGGKDEAFCHLRSDDDSIYKYILAKIEQCFPIMYFNDLVYYLILKRWLEPSTLFY